MKKNIIVILLTLFSITGLKASSIVIESPKAGYMSDHVYWIKGSISGYSGKSAILVLNGLPQSIPVVNGRFSVKAVASPGNNLLEIHANGQKERVSFFAKVPSKDIKVLLTWDTPSFVDLWVIDPTGEKCYWNSTVTKNGGNLVYDDSNYAPQTFTMVKALPGNYSIQIQNYGAFGHPVSRVKVYLVLYEGTPKEIRKEWIFTATKERTVYHIADFFIESEEK
ncbi:MAG TPA: DUF2135 domain-containing protein [Spirochaetota bacterium]|jgi:uncharacterized protein YfaP (DUF2135 family)|nr:DUF2135 domain-containing protein [Spirochaetota bacterium]HOH35981.1 DUF2135 domain-containing protein [Spirochaetota bacterium]HPJ13441.1 DUF2135 domain-containing protein [Spirochaetota bacterium]HPM32960.1 DUF2135 domain-containing protein [Spirochaetota bacterium]HPW50924.1 DUF2135 domain-containing protein [Spirochaetota bacterium]